MLEGMSGKKLEHAERELAQAEAMLSEMRELYKVDSDNRWCIHLTDEGTTVAQEITGVGSFDDASNAEWPHLIETSLRAHLLYKKNREYVLQDGRVVILDEYTGRLRPKRKWSEGLHQAIEAKEGVEITSEIWTKATILVQDYFRRYKRLCGDDRDSHACGRRVPKEV